MELLDLSQCKTNEAVCKLVSERVNSIPFKGLIEQIEQRFVYQTAAAKAIYTGLSMNMNVFLSGPGGYGKSTLIKFILDFYAIPYTVVVGYKDMPVDALLGIPDMDKLLKESKYEINFKQSSFYKPGILIGEEFTDIHPSTAAALKDILTERGLHSKEGKIESLISCMIIAANKSSKEVVDDESKRAFYDERFPLQVEVNWQSHTVKDYFKLLKLSFKDIDDSLLFFMAKLFEDNHANFNNTLSPRIACDITKVYINKGIGFLDNFSISTVNINMLEAEAKKEYNTKSTRNLLKDIIDIILSIESDKGQVVASLYALKRLDELTLSDEILKPVLDAKVSLKSIVREKPITDPNIKAMEAIFKVLEND